MKQWILSLFVLLSLLALTGCEKEEEKGAITGIVTNTNGDAIPIANISVIYTDGNKTTTTNTLGKYSVNELPSSGNVTVRVSKEGYLSEEQTAQLAKSEIVLDFELSLDTTTPALSTVTGVITNVAGDPLQGVRVFSSIAESSTAANGEYTLLASVGEKVSITADLENYTQNSRNVIVVGNETSTLDMTLVVVDKITVFDVNTEATITAKGATVKLGASSIVNTDGTNYTGNVVAKVSFNQVSSTTGSEAFPGDYIGLQINGEETVLQSYGFIDVTLEDENGNALRLADGATARLTYPMDTNITTTPATIPLWYYDTELGVWVEDGIAAYDAATNSYSGDVSHFTTWNLDAKVPRATYNGCVEDQNGVRIPTATIHFTAPGYNKTSKNNDVNGAFGFRNAPSGLPITLKASAGGFVSQAVSFTLNAGQLRSDSQCLVVDSTVANIYYRLSGRAIYSDGLPVPTVYISDNGRFSRAVNTDANGYFISDNIERTPSGQVVVTVSAPNFNLSNAYAVDPVNTITNIGTIEVKGTHVTGCVSAPDGNRTFNLYPNIKLHEPYGDTNVRVERTDGSFDFFLAQDNTNQDLYIFNGESNLTKKVSLIASADNIDFSSPCIILEPVLDINKTVNASITTVDSSTYLKVVRSDYADYERISPYGRDVLVGDIGERVQEKSFSLSQNGVYYIFQMTDNGFKSFDGTISITIDGITHTITIPVDPNQFNAYEAWAGFAIEVYQGEIKIIELNLAAEIPS